MKTERRLKTEGRRKKNKERRLKTKERRLDKKEDWEQYQKTENKGKKTEEETLKTKERRQRAEQETENRKRRKNWLKTGHKRRTLIMMTEEWRLKTEGIKLRKEGKREHLKDHWRQVRWKNRKRTGGKEKRVTTSERRLKTEGR